MKNRLPGESSAQDDEDLLMLRYARGDITAFEEIYDRFERRLYDFCLRQLGDSEAAADAFQEVLKRVVDARRTYKPRGRFASWIFTIARRVCVDQFRSANRQIETGAVADHHEVESAAITDVEDELAHRDELQRLLALLPPEQREVLLLSKYQGFTYREVGELLGSTEVAVRQKVYRALKTIRAHARASEGRGLGRAGRASGG